MSGPYRRKRFDWFALVVSILVAAAAVSILLTLVTYEPRTPANCPR